MRRFPFSNLRTSTAYISTLFLKTKSGQFVDKSTDSPSTCMICHSCEVMHTVMLLFAGSRLAARGQGMFSSSFQMLPPPR